MIRGSVEVIQGSSSRSQRVSVASLAAVPAVLASNFSFTNAVAASPVTVGTVASAGAWTGTVAGKPAVARLWEDIPFEATAIGKRLASGALDPMNPGGE